MKLDKDQRSIFKDKTFLISKEFKDKSTDARELMKYLVEKRNEAQLVEEEDEDDLKRQGILLGQHIPSLPTKLDLDKEIIAQYGRYATSLANASDLIGMNKTNKLRRTGNLPISEAVEERKNERNRAKAAQVIETPSFLLKTEAVEVKEETMKIRYASTFKAREMELLASRLIETGKDTGNNKKTLNSKEIFPKRSEIMSAEERLANEEVLKSMNHKLNYKRNPHNDPDTINNILVKPGQKRHIISKDQDGARGSVSSSCSIQVRVRVRVKVRNRVRVRIRL
jgi:hypothetical protein